MCLSREKIPNLGEIKITSVSDQKKLNKKICIFCGNVCEKVLDKPHSLICEECGVKYVLYARSTVFSAMLVLN